MNEFKFEFLLPGAVVGYNQKQLIADFLFNHLDEYGDKKEDISKAIEYALSGVTASPGGFVLTAEDNGKIVGAVVINRTGMEGYIPENILVYIATHKEYRGKGLGKQLMERSINHAHGSIALHVEPDNPARHLYEKMGFHSKYLEMRLTR